MPSFSTPWHLPSIIWKYCLIWSHWEEEWIWGRLFSTIHFCINQLGQLRLHPIALLCLQTVSGVTESESFRLEKHTSDHLVQQIYLTSQLGMIEDHGRCFHTDTDQAHSHHLLSFRPHLPGGKKKRPRHSIGSKSSQSSCSFRSSALWKSSSKSLTQPSNH